MVSGETILTSVLSVVFSIIAAYIAIVFILPIVRALVKEIIGEENAVVGFMSILVMVIYILLFENVVKILTSESLAVSADGGKSALSYLSVLNSGIVILDKVLSYIGWVLLGILIAFGLKHYFKKK